MRRPPRQCACGWEEGGVLRTAIHGSLPDGPTSSTAREAKQPCSLPGEERGSSLKAPEGAPRPVSSTAPLWKFPVQPSPSGEVLGAGSVNKKWGVGKSEPREHRVDDWEPWTGRHGNRFRPSPGLRAALPRSVTCPPPGLRDMTSGVTVSPQERILSFMLDLKVDFKGVKTYNL